MFDWLVFIDTENWQINYLAWLSLGRPGKLLLLSSDPNPENNPRLPAVETFFQGKGVSQYLLHESALPADPVNGPSVVSDALSRHCVAGHSICLFRSGGTKLHSETFLLAALKLSRDPVWSDRLVLAAAERDLKTIHLHRIRGDVLIPTSRPVEFKGEDLDLADLSAISGCRLSPCPLPPPWFDAGCLNEPAWQQAAGAKLMESAENPALLFSWLRDWDADRTARKKDLKDGEIKFATSEKSNSAAQRLFSSIVSGFSTDYDKSAGVVRLAKNAISGVCSTMGATRGGGPDQRLGTLAGKLFETVIAAAWLKEQLTGPLKGVGNKCRLWQGIEPVLAGRPTTEFDYFLLHDSSQSCIFECKADYRDLMPAAGHGRPSQSELQIRYADLLTGVQQRVVFVFPVEHKGEYGEAMDTACGIPAAYPERLGFRAVPICLHDFKAESTELRRALA